MPHYGTLRDYRFESDVEEIRGTNVYGRDDEKLGTIQDVIFDHESGDVRYLVIDTGGWLRSNRFLVPPDRLSAYGDKGEFYADLNKEQIERFPEYDEKMFESEDSERRFKDYEERYERSWSEAPVLHREGTDRILTPTPEEMPGGPPSGGSKRELHAADLYPEQKRTSNTPILANTTQAAANALHSSRTTDTEPAGGPDVRKATAGHTSGAVQGGQRGSDSGTSKRLLQDDQTASGRRWRSFQERMRSNRQKITGAHSCRFCSEREKVA